jgi:hypothetical protein
MKRTHVIAILSTILLSVVMNSCSKDDNNDPATEEESTVSMTNAKVYSDALYDDVSMEVLQVNTDAGLSLQPSVNTQACATITVSPNDATWPKTVTIDYGTAGCTGANGYIRKGKIIYTLNKKLLTTGAVLTASFDNYSVNGYKLEGTYTITNNGSSAGLNVTIVLTNGKVTYPTGAVYTKASNTTWVQAAGMGTLTVLDDEFYVTGNGSVSSSGNTLTAASVGNLYRTVVCTNTVSGVLNLNYNNITGTLDFGVGDCDKTAVLTVAGKEYNVVLP